MLESTVKPEKSGALFPVYADLHIHLGWAGQPGGSVKIAAARDLTLANILTECRFRKGIRMIGVIDAATTGALHDLEGLMQRGLVTELAGGGLSYEGEVTLIPGAEVEVGHASSDTDRERAMELGYQVSGCSVHLCCYLPGLRELQEFSRWQGNRVKNRQLSSQRHHHTSAAQVTQFVGSLGGIVIPAHIFTPFKAALGAASSIAAVIPPDLWRYIPAVELGLSSDTELAEELDELSHFSYLTNSDAHSLGKIGREYNVLQVGSPTFAELVMALREQDGRRVAANFGLQPRLGKYHRTYCLSCEQQVPGEPPVMRCTVNPAHRLVPGVLDRIRAYSSLQGGATAHHRRIRPPYVHQIPLQFVPGLGKKGLERLLHAFGTEMNVLHEATEDELSAVVGPALARLVVLARTGDLTIAAGGGGLYGRVLRET